MKKNAKILSLFIALIMIFALTLPTLAYETDGLFNNVTANFNPGPPADEWVVSTIYHWVVRGDTLPGIAQRYGTTVDLIVENNWDYFKDLSLRNQTTTLGIELENGVRLKIYDVITVRHYVVRGDTLNDLAGGKLKWTTMYLTAAGEIVIEWFTLRTTVAAIKNENADWFRNLDLLNITQDENVPLVESNNIFAYYRGFAFDNDFPMLWQQWTIDGSPLYITVPIEYYYDIRWPAIRYGTWTYLRDYSETKPGALNPLMPAQTIFGNTVPSIDYVPPFDIFTITTDPAINWPNINPIGNYRRGWSLNQALLGSDVPGSGPNVGAYDWPQLRIVALEIPGFGEYWPWQQYISLK